MNVTTITQSHLFMMILHWILHFLWVLRISCRFSSKKINKHLQLLEKSETPQTHIHTLHDHSQKFAAQSESLKWSLLEKEPFTHMIDVGAPMGGSNQHEVSQVFLDKISQWWTITCMWDVLSTKILICKAFTTSVFDDSTVMPKMLLLV